LHALGTTLVIVRNRLKTGGYQQARINKLFELQRECRATFWTNQYNNPEAPNAYSRVAEWLHRSKRSVDVLVAPVGTGSCATGLTRELRALGHSAVLIAVDTHGSVLFGLQDGKRLLRGLGNSIIPTNLDYRVVDECHWVSAAEAFYLTNYIYRELLLDVGPSSAAAYMAAEWAARTNPAKSVFFVCADGGERYRFTVGDPAWRRFNGVEISQVPSEPINVTDPTQVGRSWSAMKWCRRRLVDASVIPAY
jgi:cysteine synthase A